MYGFYSPIPGPSGRGWVDYVLDLYNGSKLARRIEEGKTPRVSQLNVRRVIAVVFTGRFLSKTGERSSLMFWQHRCGASAAMGEKKYHISPCRFVKCFRQAITFKMCSNCVTFTFSNFPASPYVRCPRHFNNHDYTRFLVSIENIGTYPIPGGPFGT